MGRYRCPSCATIVDAPDPTTLVCPACGFGDPSRISGAPPTQPAQYVPPHPQPQAYATPTASPYGASAPAPQPPQYPPGPGPGHYAQQPLTTPGQSVAALVFGIISVAGLCVAFVPWVGGIVPTISGIVAIVTGANGIRAANRDPTHVGGKGMAVTGLVLGIIGIAIGVLFLLLMLFVAAIYRDIFTLVL